MQVDGKVLIQQMENRMNALKRLIDMDFAGDTIALENKYKELKYWKEALERGEFNVQIW